MGGGGCEIFAINKFDSKVKRKRHSVKKEYLKFSTLIFIFESLREKGIADLFHTAMEGDII